MKVAIFGCLHGMLDAMFSEVEDWERRNRENVDFIIVCGDCQTIRHKDDLMCLSVPDKYKKIGDFHQYYSGQKKIPKLTIFVGGNHEASNYLMTLPYGGWVCDNFYYLGYAGVINYKGLRIAGVSGIYNYWSHGKGRFETMPLDSNTMKSIYHTRLLDIFRLQLLSKNAEAKNPIDIFLSHDWPRRVYDHGNKQQLMKFKPHFRKDIESRDGLGNPLTEPLIKLLKPRRWFAAHLHCRFDAKINHNESSSASNKCTEFLSLNKIENKRNFMEVMDIIPTREFDESDNEIYYDEEWLTILRNTINLESSLNDKAPCPKINDDSWQGYLATEDKIESTISMINKFPNGFQVPRNFKMSEPVIYNRSNGVQPSLDCHRKRFYPNPQTLELCSKLQIHQDGTEIPAYNTSNVKPEPNSTKNQASQSSTSSSNSNNNNSQDVKFRMKQENLLSEQPTKRVALDDDGCLPFFIDTKGDRK